MDVLAQEALDRHARAYPHAHTELLPVGGVYAWRREGERHMWNPETVAALQHAVRHGGQEAYDEYARQANEESTRRSAIRGLLRFSEDVTPIPLEDVAARGGDRQALRHRGDEPGLDLHRGARDARDRDEPDRRQVQHRRGRGGPAALRPRPQRRLPPLGDQAGRLGPLRRDRELPDQRRRAADQDGPGREARRGRAAARPQGRRATSARSATRRPASASSLRRRTTTSTRSRTSSS